MRSQLGFVDNNFTVIGLKCIMQKGVRLSSETCNMFKSNLSSIRHEARPQHLYLTRLNMGMSSEIEDRSIHPGPLIWIYMILESSILSPGFVFQDLLVESATPTLSKTIIRACYIILIIFLQKELFRSLFFKRCIIRAPVIYSFCTLKHMI